MTKSRLGSDAYEQAIEAGNSPLLGILPLYTPDIPVEQIKADILMIHGLTGHPIQTWSRGGVCWPHELLPSALPEPVRVLTFGYDAGRFGGDANLDIEDAALQLISTLQRIRASLVERRRPLVAVAHSLGGNVLKKALIVSNNKPSLGHILGRLAGIIFLATPHRGSALADVAEKLLLVNAIIRLPQNFIRSLRQNSPELTSIAEDFKQIANQRSLPIGTFYETLPVKGRFFCFSEIVVFKESAILNIKSETALGVEANHNEICKYLDANDPVFREVVAQMQEFIDHEPIHSDAQVFLPFETTQYFTGRRSYLQQIYEVFGSSDGHRIVVIYGDGGMGKTEVALKYARENEHHYDYIFFANATSVQTLEASLTDLYERLRLPCEQGREVENMKRFLRREGSWLMILDNDDDWVSLQHLGMPQLSHGHIIITCRSGDHVTDPRINKSLRMKALQRRDAKELLFSRAGISLEQRAICDQEATNVVKYMGCQPLAVDSAAAYIWQRKYTFDEYLAFLKSKGRSLGALSYRPKNAQYQTSIETILQITLDEIKKNTDAYRLLMLLVWLDRSKTTVDFLKRAVTPQRRWGSDGKPSMRDPRESYVPEDIIELISSPRFNPALRELKSYAMIACDDDFVEETTGKEAIVLHPLTYNYVRESLAADQIVENAMRALSLVVHAHPSMQGGLDHNKFRLQDIMPHVIQCNLNRTYLTERGLDMTKALEVMKEDGKPSFSEMTIEFCLEMVRGYGEGKDEIDGMLVTWLQELLKSSNNPELQARLWVKRLVLEFYSHGKYTEGCEAVDRFLQNVKLNNQAQAVTSRTNAHFGFLRYRAVEHLPREKNLTPKQVWEKRMAYIEEWQPLDQVNPSELENHVVGLGVRMRGKLAKDYQMFKEAYYSLKLFVEKYATRGSLEEGWAIADIVHVILTLEDTADGPEILDDLMMHGTKFGENLTFPPGARACEIASYISSRVIERRMFERGYLGKDVRENDTMLLEINHAASVLREGRFHAERYSDAEQQLRGLKARFEKIRSEESLWHDDQMREFAVIAYLAQISHLRHDWPQAHALWQEAIDYGVNLVTEWPSDHHYIEVARYSLADVLLSAGADANLVIPGLKTTIERLAGEREMILPGIGSYWLDYVREQLEPKLKIESTRLQRGPQPGVSQS